MPKAWKRIEPTHFVTAVRRGMTIKTFKRPDGSITEYDIFDRDNLNHAGVVALTPDYQVIIAEQFRAGPEIMAQEIPGGSVDSGETPLEAAKRELVEETCYQPKTIEPLGFVYKDGYMNARWHYFFATGCTLGSANQKLDVGEDITVKLISIDTFIENARQARMTDVEAVFLAYDKLKELKGKR